MTYYILKFSFYMRYINNLLINLISILFNSQAINNFFMYFYYTSFYKILNNMLK